MPNQTTETIDTILSQVGALLTRYGSGLRPPCPAERLATLRVRSAQELGSALPHGYATLLARTDGLDWDGAVFFASQRAPIVGHPDRFINDVVEMNLIQRDNPDMTAWFVCGDSDMELYAQHLATGRFHVLDQVSAHSYEAYDTFGELFTAVYSGRL